jgi:cytidyltransferase-like protein
MALPKLRDHFNDTNRENFMAMLTQKVHAVEKIAASSFHVRRDDLTNKYYKSGSERAMDIVDRTIVRFYENAIRHFQGLGDEMKSDMPKDWKFGFDYLIENETPNFKYALLPKNNLILTHIQVLNESGRVSKVIRDTEVLNKWAKKLDVQKPPVIFEGMLTMFQKEQLIKILEMNDNEFEKVYENRSFTRDIYNIFNSGMSRTALNESVNEEIDGLVVSFVDGKSMKSFKLEDYRRKNEETERKSSDVYQITMVDVIEYFTNHDFSQYKLVEEKKDRRFIEIMSESFNDYIKANAAKYIGVKFETADFAKNEAFNLNTAFLKNEQTLKYVNNPILSELFKIVLSSFRNKREKASDILTEDMVAQLNEIIDKIYEQIDAKLEENDVMDFTSFKKWSSIQEDAPEGEVNEALKVKTLEHGKQKVNMFVGRFQPFTLGHAKVLQSLHDQNGLPVVVFLVKSKTAKKEDAFKRPYDEAMQMKMFKAVQREYKFLKDIIVVPFAAIDALFNELRPKYEPVLWGTGTDRMAAYSSQAYKETYREQLNVLPEFGMHEIHRTDDDISATAVRNAMMSDNKTEFQRMTPKSLHGMYPVLQSELLKAMTAAESKVNEELMTFEQFINKFSNE